MHPPLKSIWSIGLRYTTNNLPFRNAFKDAKKEQHRAAPHESKKGVLQLQKSLHEQERKNTNGDKSIKKSLHKTFE
jgi:hypothetical protein